MITGYKKMGYVYNGIFTKNFLVVRIADRRKNNFCARTRCK